MATLKNTSISGNQSLDLPTGTTAQRPPSPANGHTRFNTDYSTVEYYQNGSWYSIDRNVRATSSGSVHVSSSQDNNTPYTVHTFTGDGTLDVIYGGTIEYMLIGGGGGGGEGSQYDDGGGGGAGGMLMGTTQLLSNQYTINVGAGGGSATSSNGNKGGDTTAFGLTAFGGGGGAGHRRDAPYASGGGVGVIGSGGGAGGAYGSTDSGDGITRGGSGTPGQGFDGGTNNYRNYLGAGGGGAGQNGSSNHGDGNGGQGGRGRMSTLSGFPCWYAGGGGGFGYNSVRNGGLGGGGKGVFGGVAGYAGGKNSGGGGAGGTNDRGSQSRSKDGGTGIAIIRYKDTTIPSSRPDAVRIPKNAILSPLDGLVFELDAGDPGSYNYGKDPRIWYDRYNNVDITLDGTADGVGTQIYSTSHGGAIIMSQSGCHVTQGWSASIDVDDNTTRRSWEVWAMPTAVANTQGIFGHKAGSGCSYYCNGGIFINNGQWSFNWYDNSSYRFLDSGVNAVNGEYAHVVCTMDKDRRPEIYVNGILRAKYGSATNMDYSSGMELVNIGYNDKNGGQHYFEGEIAICRFYKGQCLREIGAKQNFEAYRGRFGL
jgi:hypothetical protein